MNDYVIILELEQQLLCEDVRSSPEKIAEILADGCLEYCSSGRIYRYTNGDIFGHGKQQNWEIVDFAAQQLAADVVLATYRLIKYNEPDNAQVSLRSSIWIFTDGKWKMIFHQGTPSHPK